MEKRIKDRFTPEILNQSLALYEIDPGDIDALDGFESFIYEFNRADGPGILRISHSIRRSTELILGEVDWIRYLHEGGAPVARPIPSLNGKLVEAVNDLSDGSFLAAAFERAQGGPHQGDRWTDSLLFEYGKSLGLIHKLSKNYKPTKDEWKRPEWDDPVMLEIDRFVPSGDKKILEIYHQLRTYLNKLPRNAESYGLIHQDAHRGNFFVSEEGKITLFDFDDCVYSWFINDIALVLFYAVMGQENPDQFIRDFLNGFLPGYYSQFQLATYWFKEIPHFMKLREIDLYAVIHRSFGLDYLEDPWCAWYMGGRKEKLEAEVSYLDFDFQTFPVESYLNSK